MVEQNMARTCPNLYVEHSNACYFFGPYTNYDAAKRSCEEEGARLAEVDPVNDKYLMEQIEVLGSNDHWIGSYVVRNKVMKKKGGLCPMFRGQMGSRDNSFSQLNCNSAYPYICQKYGQNRYNNRHVEGYPGFNPYQDDIEIPITNSPPSSTSEAVEKVESNSGVIAALVCIAVLILLAILVRYACNKRSAKKSKRNKEKAEAIKQQLQTSNSFTNPALDNSLSKSMASLNKVSRNNTMGKSLDLLENGVTVQHPRSRRHSYSDMHGSAYLPDTKNPEDFYEAKSLNNKESSYYQDHHPNQNRSREHYLQRRQESPTSLESHYRSSVRRGQRRRLRSADETTMDFTTNDYLSGEESNMSDSAISTSTRMSYRSYWSGRSGIHSHPPPYRSTESLRYYDEDAQIRSSGGRRRRHRRRSRHLQRSMFERYAEGRPPSPAMDVMVRHINSNKFREQQSFLRRMHPEEREIDGRFSETVKPSYFPQMSSMWSHDELPDLNNDLSISKQRQQQEPNLRSRTRLQGHIRVNRHIHNNTMDETNTFHSYNSESDESEHIYESLDDLKLSKKHPKAKKQQAIPLHISSNKHSPQTFTRNRIRSSVGSRISIQSRGLPALPTS